MRKTTAKYYTGIIILIFIESLHFLFFENNDKYDVYLYYDHERYLTNILYDIATLFKFSLLTFWLIKLNRKVFKPLFILSILVWVSYFLTYNQITSLFILPIYALLVLYYNSKYYKNG